MTKKNPSGNRQKKARFPESTAEKTETSPSSSLKAKNITSAPGTITVLLPKSRRIVYVSGMSTKPKKVLPIKIAEYPLPSLFSSTAL